MSAGPGQRVVFRCFDCGELWRPPSRLFGEPEYTATYVSTCQECGFGMLLVWELDGLPVNREYFTPERWPA